MSSKTAAERVSGKGSDPIETGGLTLFRTPSQPARARWSLAARLTAWYAGSAFLLILAATGFLYWALASNLDREDDEFLEEKVHLLRTLLADPHRGAALRHEVGLDNAGLRAPPMYVRVLAADGTKLLETPGMSAELPPAVFPPPAGEEPGHGTEIRSATGKHFRIVAARGADEPSAPRVLQVAFDRTYEMDLLADYRRHLWVVLGAALVACALTGYAIAWHGLRPLGRITRTAGHIRSSTLHERLDLGGLPAELADLAVTFNDMLDRLEESFQRLARFSADIAHELRTPLNNLRGEAEVALGRARSPEEYQQVLGSCLEESLRLTHLIDSLLFLARSESPRAGVNAEPVNVGRELAAVCEFYEPAAHEAGVALTVTAPGDLVADLDRTLFQRAVGNLVANALAHTPPGGTVTLSAAAEGDAVRVEVTDTGTGIPPEHLPHVFDRFYRADQVRSGSSGRVGLGLAIVKSIAALHRGGAAITSEVGRGTRVRLVLPASAPTRARSESASGVSGGS
jgi:two-component system heavy metal sensor histidine kinase CusS